MKKHEWKRSEKEIYLPKTEPQLIAVPEFKFVTLEGEGNPNSPFFSDYVSVLYSMAYAIKMNLKKSDPKPEDYNDYTVYPLEGIWDLKSGAKGGPGGSINKDELVFKLMIRQPNFLEESFFDKMLELTKKKKPHQLLDNVRFERISDGVCIQMMHIGSYDDEPESFTKMEAFASENGFIRVSEDHREIYISDFRKVAPEKLKTVLRFKVKPKS
ncbi:MAG: hypothetical protein HKO90_05425 [Flavobacteriaceae bacterium]|nr:hypothetical protein [Flavobacteriaceae bacterium]